MKSYTNTLTVPVHGDKFPADVNKSGTAGAFEYTVPPEPITPCAPKLLGSAVLTKHGHSSCQTGDKHVQGREEQTTEAQLMEVKET